MRYRAYCDAGITGNGLPTARSYGSFLILETVENQPLIHKSRVPLKSITNNAAEWEIFLLLLQSVETFQPYSEFTVYSDSKIMVNQFNRLWDVKNEILLGWAEAGWALERRLMDHHEIILKLRHVPRIEIVRKLGH